MQRPTQKTPHAARTPGTPSAVERHIETIAQLEQRWLEERKLSEHLGDAVAARVGSMPFVIFHAIWFAAWVVVNLGWIPGVQPFDPFPFGLLTLVVSLEAIFLSLFLLISQNRLQRHADKRTHLDLQVNLLIETEVTTMLRLMQRLSSKLGVVPSDDDEVAELSSPTDVPGVVDAVERTIPEADTRAQRRRRD